MCGGVVSGGVGFYLASFGRVRGIAILGRVG